MNKNMLVDLPVRSCTLRHITGDGRRCLYKFAKLGTYSCCNGWTTSGVNTAPGLIEDAQQFTALVGGNAQTRLT